MSAVLVWVIGFILAVTLVAGGLAKLIDERSMVRLRQHLAVDRSLFRLTGLLQIVFGCAIVAGLVWSDRFPWVGLAAGIAIIAIMALTVYYHRRVNDGLSEYTVPVLIALVAAAYMIALVTHNVAT
jgi:hypothetical protein